MVPLILALLLGAPAAAAPTLASLAIPGTPAFAKAARDVVAARIALDPSMASNAGLFDDSARVPSFSPEAVAAMTRRLDGDLAALRRMPWRSWDTDRQVDWRWVYANAQDARRQVAVERLFLRRPSAWLEPVANNLIALTTYAPERADLRAKVVTLLPGMLAEMRRVCTAPTARDAKTADGVAQGILTMLAAEPPGPGRDGAAAALRAYLAELAARRDLPEFAVVGAENYAWRLEHALLLPWEPRRLLALAQSELTEADAALAALAPRVSSAAAPTPAQAALAAGLDQAALL
ncbi:MAG: hypothetical protein HYV15_00315, partial [Elusimicrobia bacterium]|nr:hypothetical protein [Elusimicrobiota bacterium]